MSSSAEVKSAKLLAFEHYLRTGRRLHPNANRLSTESKFNPWHDPENGQFTDALHGSASLGGPNRTSTSWVVSTPTPKSSIPKPQRPDRTASSHPASAAHPAGWRQGGNLQPAEVEKHADNAMAQYYENRRRGMAPDDAAAWAANSEIESRGDHRSRQEGGGPGRGLYQWGSDSAPLDRRIDFQRVMGVPIERATREQQHRFRDYELSHKEKSAKLAIDAASGAGNKAFAISMRYLRPRAKAVTATARANLAEAILRKARLQAAKRARPKKLPTGLPIYFPPIM